MAKFSTNTKTDVLIHLGIILSVLLILFFGFFFVYLPWSTNHGEAILVPELKGLTLAEAKEALDDADLDYEVSDSQFVAGLKPLSIISNYPKSGAYVKSNRKIFLTVAAVSAPLVKLPNIIGRSSLSAQNQLLSSGLQFGGEEKVPALEENTILKVKLGNRELMPGDEIPKGSKIIFVVGDGYADQKIDVPNVVGMEQDEADILLTGLGLTVGQIITEPSSAPAGSVIRQRPASGSDNKIRIGAPVDLWVSAGGGPIEE
ncbi:PASTA domain-containing protein [Leadbetterella sp. DM7]|uniref:PASTA domain-containing protein n=1 Tax=Leadbetterella sp. DM7 TaxID=3235085 RepID=UPI00349E8767